jgi:glutamine synthetase
VRRELEPPAPITGDAYAIGEDRLTLPTSLDAALVAFAVDDDLGITDRFRRHYGQVVRREAIQYASAITDWARARYLHHA